MERIQSSVLKAEQLSKQVSSPEGLLTILDQVSLEVQTGESVAVVGVSGAGKSTLLGLLAGLDVPSSGQVWINETDITCLDEDGRAAVRANQVGFVFQSFHLIPSLTALENVMLPLELAGRDDAREAARAALTTVGLDPRRHHYPRQLSGGEKQRVAIARAFAAEPELVICDEITAALDVSVQASVTELLIELQEQTGTACLFITHDLNLVRQLAHRIIVMQRGKLVDAFDRHDAEAADRNPYTRALLEAVPPPASEAA